MKYPASRVCQRRFGALALGILLLAHVDRALGQSKPVNIGPNANEFGNLKAVPDGISAADWAAIRAAHQATLKRSRLAPNEPARPMALAADDLAQQAYAKASNTDPGDRFGHAVAVSGDTVVVAADYEFSNATGVNGDQSDNSVFVSGAVYVFVRNGTTWSQQAYLKASNTGAGDQFGNSVAVSGDTVVVGAAFESSNATGINGNESDNSASEAGAAYVFVRNGTTWSQQAYLKASNTGAGDSFGISVAVSGNTVVVGADLESSNATGVNGDQSDNSASQAGAVYVFVRSGTTWSQQAYLKASNTDAGDAFGISVAVSDDTVSVGANFETSNATGVNGDQSANSAFAAGAAYVFVRNGTTWSQQAYLKASNTESFDRFGTSAAVSGDTVVVGAAFESSNATGINGDQSNNNAPQAGAAYIFVRNGTTWSQQAYLKASNTDLGDAFGISVAVSGDVVVAGAHNEYSNATGVNGDQTDNSASLAGAAYVFERNGTTWSQQAYLKASNTDAGDQFGGSVAVSDSTVVVGATFEDSNATGINGNQSNDSATDAGAAYVFAGLGPAPIIPLLNISTRLNVGIGDNVLIGGFIVTGTDPKKVLIRAIGPSLADFGVLNPLADPTIELHEFSGTVVTNDNWRDTQEQEILATMIPPSDNLESAIIATLDPGPHTAIVSGKNGGTGIGLVEVYDLDQAADSQLGNISTRGFVDTDENVMIGGFIVGEGGATTVLVRAIGPTLGALGVSDPLQNPTLELHGSDGTLLAFDDDWKD
ncbi:MAG: FG-GAP repeat protein, partial [Spartobacteria bacterium]